MIKITSNFSINLLILTFMTCGIVSSKTVELCELSKEWGDRAYEKNETCSQVELNDLNLEAASFTIGGFSSGGILSTNLFTMFNDNIDGAIINSALGSCANFGAFCDNETIPVNYTMTGMKGKPMFFYSGVKDPVVNHTWSVQTSNIFEEQGVNIRRRWVRDFLHIFPNSVTSNFRFNPLTSCGIKNEQYSAVQNCGWNMALEGLSHIFGTEYLEKAINYQDQGKLWAIDQTPFNDEGAKLAN